MANHTTVSHNGKYNGRVLITLVSGTPGTPDARFEIETYPHTPFHKQVCRARYMQQVLEHNFRGAATVALDRKPVGYERALKAISPLDFGAPI